MTDQEPRVSPLSVAADGLLLVCAMAGATASFLSLYGDARLGALMTAQATPLDQCAAWSPSFLFLSVVFALLSLCLWSLPRGCGKAAGGAFLLWAGVAFYSRERAFQGAVLCLHTVTDLFSSRVPWGRTFQYDSGLAQTEQGAAARLALILALCLLALVLGWAVVRSRRWWMVVLLTLPPLLPGLLADLYPDWPAFMALSACWCAMLLTSLCRWSAPSGRGRLTLAALAGSAVMLAAITLIFPMEGYARPGWALRLEDELSSTADRLSGFLSRFDGPFGAPVTFVGTAGEADLAGAGPLHYTGRTVLRVSSDRSGRLYLRGSSLAVYRDGRWTAPPQGSYQGYLDSVAQKDPVSPLLFPSLLGTRGDVYTATVVDLGAMGNCGYAPYHLVDQDWAETGVLPMEDAFLARREGGQIHTVSFTDAAPRPDPPVPSGDGPEREADLYADYVRSLYLQVPDELVPVLTRVLEEDSDLLTGGYAGADRRDIAAEVAALLERRCRYDLATPAAPEGTDPVAHFLTESRQGYCMHYASSAVLMLRLLGVPARYVSGFTADCHPGRWTHVPDRAAHAWAEIWLDGFGWCPAEVTPAAASAWHEQEEPIGPSSDPLPESEEPQPTPTPSTAPAPSARPTPDPQGNGQDEQDGPGEDAAPASSGLPVQAAAVVSGVLLLLWLGQRLPKRYRDRRLSSPDRDRAALDAYGYLRRMERWGGRMDPRALELAQKARFSQHPLTQEELGEMRALVDRERERLCVVLGPAARLAFLYLWGMPRPARPGTPPKDGG